MICLSKRKQQTETSEKNMKLEKNSEKRLKVRGRNVAEEKLTYHGRVLDFINVFLHQLK